MNFARILVPLALLLSSAPLRAEVMLTPKHLIILRQGLDAVYGSYVFAVQNNGEATARFKSAVMLPKETVDFVPQEGVEPDEVSLAPGGGGVVVEKDFPPGVHIVSIGFKVDASYGKAMLTLTPPAEIQSFTLLLPRGGGMRAVSTILKPGEMGHAPDPQYEAMISEEPLGQGASFTVDVQGLPEGRTRIWIVGAAVGVFLLLLAAFFAFRTRPRVTGKAGETVLIG